MDNRRKVTFYLNPDKNVADKRVCDYLEGVPLKQRGEFSRNALFAGYLIAQMDERIIKAVNLLASENSDFMDMLKIIQDVVPNFESNTLNVSRVGRNDTSNLLENSPGAGQQHSLTKQNVSTSEDVTRKNAKKLF
ncbi:plasmid partitioning/stability family protein [Rouxiella badensis]|uniref:plasmid partitioning/stability family protein n=1 Tax=Rouxiella badensis TaxID=1646377 RepID=UPI001788700F|nr:plasmid partitioning/stability family protein [Rouxiella badensis]QOI58071.1 hypothetical protein H2866_23235 [Rouxiella badensis subsp. acadiensis]